METGDVSSLNLTMSAEEQAVLNQQVNTLNKANVVNGRPINNTLGKDDFLKLLITQMSHQDPTSPMENTEFIAQMAQFSSLEQITNMNQSFQQMNAVLASNQATQVLGKTVEVDLNGASASGVVDAVTYGENPQVRIGNMFYDMKSISAVYGE